MSGPPNGRRPRPNPTAAHNPYSFRHNGGSDYDILWRDTVEFSGRAYGVSAFVVNQHRTTMMSKRVPDCERIDKVVADGLSWWVGKHGPKTFEISSSLAKILNELMDHHQMVILRMITE